MPTRPLLFLSGMSIREPCEKEKDRGDVAMEQKLFLSEDRRELINKGKGRSKSPKKIDPHAANSGGVCAVLELDSYNASANFKCRSAGYQPATLKHRPEHLTLSVRLEIMVIEMACGRRSPLSIHVAFVGLQKT
jgi:hypothetical protein